MHLPWKALLRPRLPIFAFHPVRSAERRYSAIRARFSRGSRAIYLAKSGSLGGRGPPGRRRRRELQALSNSLQLASW
jgi:hypothetical protein